MNILVTLDKNYIPPLKVMLRSLFITNPQGFFDLYVAHSSLTVQDINSISESVDSARCTVHPIKLDSELLKDAPVLKRISKETYYRLLATDYLPKTVDRILYIDPDTVFLNPVEKLYNINLDGKYIAAAGHTVGFIEKLNHIRLNMPKDTRYINAGIMMMNIGLMRKETSSHKVFDFIRENPKKLKLGDQDVINALYCTKTVIVDERVYNLDEKTFKNYKDEIDLAWVEKNCVIVHFNGAYKPWKPKYKGVLAPFYFRFRDSNIKSLFSIKRA